MKRKQIIQTGYDILYLSSCAMISKRPDLDIVSKMDFEAIYAMSKLQSLTSVICVALESAYGGKMPDVEPLNAIKNEYNKNYRKMVCFEIERGEIFRFLDKNGIWHLPLKGIILKNYYPKPCMRQMSDNDILYDLDYKQEVKDFFINRGYKYIEHKDGLGDKDDCFQKSPFFSFEMHRYLIEKEWYPKEYEYYSDIKQRLSCDKNNKCLYNFTDEDLYIFMVVHNAKHRNSNGNGIRSLLDFYAFLEKKEAFLDWIYIENEIKKLNLSEYEKLMKTLSKKVVTDFSENQFSKLTVFEKREIHDMYFSGAFGSDFYNIVRKQIISNNDKNYEVTNKSKFLFALNRLFPSYRFMHQNYPRIAAYRPLLVIAYPYRIIKNLFVNWDYLKKQIFYFFKS